MPWYAHSLEGRPEAEWETQREHAARVAEGAARRAGKFGMAALGEAAGQLHDLGKYTSAFQNHIAGRGRAEADRDHASAGAVYARNRLEKPLGALLAHAVAGHHAGLKDRLLGDDERLDRREAALGPVIRTARGDGFPLPEAISADLAASVGKKTGFGLALLTRMLFSCLVDADRTETRASEAERRLKAGLPSMEEDEPAFTATPGELAAEFCRTAAERDEERRLDGTAADPINLLRARVRDHVAGQADAPSGVFTLTVPTGGGKTLTSLRFALDHAATHGLDRVIVVIPFTGAWIETGLCGHDERRLCVAPSRGRGSKHDGAVAGDGGLSSLPRGGVDRNVDDVPAVSFGHVAPSRGRGSKQVLVPRGDSIPNGRSLAGAWIETTPGPRPWPRSRCRSLAGAWIATWTRTSRSSGATPARAGRIPVPIPDGPFGGAGWQLAWAEILDGSAST